MPTLALVSADPIEQLPVLELHAGKPSVCVGWQLLAGFTVSVMDGPGDAGIFIDGMARPDEAEARFAWLSAVDRAGGAVVLVVDSHDQAHDWVTLAGLGTTRGGFVPAVQRAV
ncbi:hypothetical protein ACIBI9_66500 [Nonomuraea sp. NPDC050451]|uniref:hypothetical protein n=1 Tax=Nonomuraea sp. NPDC050451 TaxID=3364364 RepID=UPI0037AB8FE8